MIFHDIKTLSAADRKYSDLVNDLKKALKPNFASYLCYDCYYTNELNEYISDELLYKWYVSDEDPDDWKCFYVADLEATERLIRWIANWDMVVIRGSKCAISASNHPDAAKILNKMVSISKN